jgi:hypothetical protein
MAGHRVTIEGNEQLTVAGLAPGEFGEVLEPVSSIGSIVYRGQDAAYILASGVRFLHNCSGWHWRVRKLPKGTKVTIEVGWL